MMRFNKRTEPLSTSGDDDFRLNASLVLLRLASDKFFCQFPGLLSEAHNLSPFVILNSSGVVSAPAHTPRLRPCRRPLQGYSQLLI